MTFQGQDAPSASRCWSLIANQSRRCRWQSCGLMFLFLSHRKASIKAQYLPPTLVCEKVFLQVLQGRLFPSAISYLLSRDFEPLYKWNSPTALCFGHYTGRFSERKTEVHRLRLQQRDQGAAVWQGKVRAACSACLLPD